MNPAAWLLAGTWGNDLIAAWLWEREHYCDIHAD